MGELGDPFSLKTGGMAAFELVRRIGQASTCTINLARWTTHDKLVVLKIYSTTALSRTRIMSAWREAQLPVLLTSCGVPNICRVHWAFQQERFIVVVQQYCEQGSIYDHLLSIRRALSEREACCVLAVPLLATLWHLRRQNVVHGDIKLENLFMTNNQVVLGDFGIAHTVTRPLTMMMGTLDFMAPEILQLPQRHDYSSDEDFRQALKHCRGFGMPVDVWALGVTMYEAMCGHRPWASKDKEGIKADILGRRIRKFPSAISSHAQDFVLAALDPDPTTRPEPKDLLAHPWVLQHVGPIITVLRDATQPAHTVQAVMETAVGSSGAAAGLLRTMNSIKDDLEFYFEAAPCQPASASRSSGSNTLSFAQLQSVARAAREQPRSQRHRAHGGARAGHTCATNAVWSRPSGAAAVRSAGHTADVNGISAVQQPARHTAHLLRTVMDAARQSAATLSSQGVPAQGDPPPLDLGAAALRSRVQNSTLMQTRSSRWDTAFSEHGGCSQQGMDSGRSNVMASAAAARRRVSALRSPGLIEQWGSFGGGCSSAQHNELASGLGMPPPSPGRGGHRYAPSSGRSSAFGNIMAVDTPRGPRRSGSGAGGLDWRGDAPTPSAAQSWASNVAGSSGSSHAVNLPSLASPVRHQHDAAAPASAAGACTDASREGPPSTIACSRKSSGMAASSRGPGDSNLRLLHMLLQTPGRASDAGSERGHHTSWSNVLRPSSSGAVRVSTGGPPASTTAPQNLLTDNDLALQRRRRPFVHRPAELATGAVEARHAARPGAVTFIRFAHGRHGSQSGCLRPGSGSGLLGTLVPFGGAHSSWI